MEKTIMFRWPYRVGVKGTSVYLLKEGPYVVLSGAPVAYVAPCIQEARHTEEEIVCFLDGILPAEEVRTLLAQLKEDGYVVELDADVSASSYQLWDRLHSNAPEALRLLRQKRVRLIALDVEEELLRVGVEEVGLRVTQDEEADLALVFVKDMRDASLASINEVMLRLRKPWMLVKVAGEQTWMSLFVPGQTPCWACLMHRLKANWMAETFLVEVAGLALPPLPESPLRHFATVQAASRGALELARWVVNGVNERVEGKLFTLDPLTGAEEQHVVLRRTHCEACGQAPCSDRAPLPLQLKSREKAGGVATLTRTLTPREAFERKQHLISEQTGFGRKPRRITPASIDHVHAFAIPHALAHRVDSEAALLAQSRVQSGGKGRSREEALTSALYELIERISGIWRGDIARCRAPYNELGSQAIHPNDHMLFSPEQFRARKVWNAAGHAEMLYVPAPFDPDEEIDWVYAWNLMDHTYRFFSAACAFYDVSCNGASFAVANSNGSAAGTTMEEAILHGLFERVERSSLSMWWYNRVPRPQVDLASFDDPYFLEMEAYYHSLGRVLYVLDVTLELDLPAFVAVSRQREGVPNWTLGFGCHLDAHTAVSRAVTEANQLLPIALPELRAGQTRYSAGGKGLLSWAQTALPEDHPYLVPDGNQRPKKAADYPRRVRRDLLEDVNTCLALARRHGLEVYVVDQTHPDINVPVAKVIIPGTYFYWRRFGGSRLYRLPVERGWLDAPRTEADLNPLSLEV